MGRAGWNRGGYGKGRRREDEQGYGRVEKRRSRYGRREFGKTIGDGVGRM